LLHPGPDWVTRSSPGRNAQTSTIPVVFLHNLAFALNPSSLPPLCSLSGTFAGR
ncbi:hypothetical protein NDU88_005738, partial [Pleurodeles waltl]